MISSSGTDSLWFMTCTLAALLGGYTLFVFGFVIRKANEWYYVWRAGKTEYTLPPGHMGWPFLGNMISFLKAFQSDADSFTSDLVSRYGRTGMYKTHLFGNPSIIVCTAETCRKVLADDERFKSGYPASTYALIGKRSFHGISDAQRRRIRRLIASPVTGHEALSMYIPIIEDIAIKHLQKMEHTHQCEFLTETRKLAFSVIATLFFGRNDRHTDLGLFENLYTDLSRGMMSPAINLPGFAFHRALKARKKMMKMLRAVVEQRRRDAKNRETKKEKDMMDLLMEVRDDEGKSLEDEDIVDLLIVFLLAGHESSAHGILWTLIYLSEHPHLFQTAKKEQEEIMKARPSTQKGLSLLEIKQMEYLSKVIDEMLRRTTILFATFRQANVDVNINGYTIPKGWKVIIWKRGVHMDPETYSNPEEFDPSRWENYKAKAGSFIPFGFGSRICPGGDLAKLEITIFLHHFLLNYRMERINPKCPITYLLLPNPSDNCLARITKAT